MSPACGRSCGAPRPSTGCPAPGEISRVPSANVSELEEHPLDVGDVVARRRGALRVLETPREAGGDEQESDLLERLVGGSDLRDDLTAVAFVRQHLLESAHLSFDPAESLLQLGDVLRVELHPRGARSLAVGMNQWYVTRTIVLAYRRGYLRSSRCGAEGPYSSAPTPRTVESGSAPERGPDQVR